MTAVTDGPTRNATSLMLEGVVVSDCLPGEPEEPNRSVPVMLLRIALRAGSTLLLLVLTSWVWPIYIILVAIYDWSPTAPRLHQVVRYLRQVWTVNPPSPGLTAYYRSWLTLTILQSCATAPLHGVAWLMDEVFYGASLDATPITAPLFEVSAARSGSTQLARYIEADPNLVSPMFIQILFPYMWLWRIVPPTLGRFISPDQVRAQMEARIPVDFFQRHEGDPFLTDTFDVPFLGHHLNQLSLAISPDIAETDFSFGALAPHNQQLWEHDFINLLDRIGRKTLLSADPGPDSQPRRLFIKGHFLCAANALEQKYPDACFLTMIREPAPRLQSCINFLRASPFDGATGRRPPWVWMGEGCTKSEVRYCELEQEWFSRKDGPKRCVLRFSEYIEDLEAAMAKVYRECLDTPILPDYVPTVHEPRVRTNYILNRSLAEFGVDEDAFNERLKGYISWCREAPES